MPKSWRWHPLQVHHHWPQFGLAGLFTFTCAVHCALSWSQPHQPKTSASASAPGRFKNKTKDVVKYGRLSRTNGWNLKRTMGTGAHSQGRAGRGRAAACHGPCALQRWNGRLHAVQEDRRHALPLSYAQPQRSARCSRCPRCPAVRTMSHCIATVCDLRCACTAYAQCTLFALFLFMLATPVQICEVVNHDVRPIIPPPTAAHPRCPRPYPRPRPCRHASLALCRPAVIEVLFRIHRQRRLKECFAQCEKS